VGVYFDQLVLQVVFKAFFQFAVFFPVFFDEVAARVVGEVFVALQEQAIAFDSTGFFGAWRVFCAFGDREDIPGGVKVEKLGVVAFGSFKAVEGVVNILRFF